MDDQEQEEQETQEQLTGYEPFEGEMLEYEWAKRSPTRISSPMLDPQYVDLFSFTWEGSIDWLVRTLGTANRIAMPNLDNSLQRLAQMRRWIPVWFHYIVEQDWTTEQTEKRALDKNGQPKPVLDPKTKRVKKDRKGNVIWEMEYGEVNLVSIKKARWLSHAEVAAKASPELRERFGVKVGAKPGEDEEYLPTPEFDQFLARYGLPLATIIENPAEIGDSDLKVGEIFKVRKWFLSEAQTERNVIGPRESFTKTPVRVLDRCFRYMKYLQTKYPDRLVPDFYERRHPEKCVQDITTREYSLVLGRLNNKELRLFTKYCVDRHFYSARRRWYWWRKERARIVVEHDRKHKKPISNGKLVDALEDVYDWWSPLSQHSFVRDKIVDEVRSDRTPDPKEPTADIDSAPTTAQRATAAFNTVNCVSHIAAYPVPNGESSVDWVPCRLIILINEEVRDLARMIGHFQQSRSIQWKYAQSNLDLGAVANATGNEWGGAQSRTKLSQVWLFSRTYDEVEGLRPTLPPIRWNERRPGDNDPAGQADYDARKAAWRAWRALRRELLGPLVSMTRDNRVQAFTGVYGAFGSRMVDVTKGVDQLRGQIALCREGSIIRWPKVVTDVLPRLRPYPKGEIQILDLEVAWWFDPWDIAKNTGGLANDAMLSDLNNRLGLFVPDKLDDQSGEAEADRDGEPLIQLVNLTEYRLKASATQVAAVENLHRRHEVHHLEPVLVDFFNQRETMRQIWMKQPFRRVRDHLNHLVESLIKAHVTHLRPHIVKDVDGLPAKFDSQIRRLYALSDDRVKRLVVTIRAIGGGAARGFDFSAANKLVDEGYGQGYGTYRDQLRRIFRLYEVALWNKYGDKIRGMQEAADFAGAEGHFEDYEKFYKWLAGELHSRGMNVDVARIAVKGLHANMVIPADYLIKWGSSKRVVRMENWFLNQMAELMSEGLVFYTDDNGKQVPLKRTAVVAGEKVEKYVYRYDGNHLIDMNKHERTLRESDWEKEVFEEIYRADEDIFDGEMELISQDEVKARRKAV